MGDIGDNDSQRARASPSTGCASPAPPAGRLDLRYADGPHDAETLLVDPVDGSLAVVTKSFGGENRALHGAGDHAAPRPAWCR